MKLSIITINYNDATGLAKTLKSVADQHIPIDFELEHIVIDGASSDSSVGVIKQHPHVSKWVSEKDKGIYNAMNKGIEIALGRRKVNDFNRSELVEDKTKGGSSETEHYIQILNSGDIMANDHVIENMYDRIEERGLRNKEIIYGNMIKEWPDGKRLNDKCGRGNLSMLTFYHGTLNHDSAWICHDLFTRFGLYDENLKVVSDWEWYLRAIPLGGVQPVYVDIDMTVFDMTGVSDSNPGFWKTERRPILERELPAMILADYDRYANDMRMIDRLKRHNLYKVVYFMERVLFKLEKWGILGR